MKITVNKWKFIACLGLITCFAGVLPAAVEFVLAADGQPKAAILLGNEPSVSARLAAYELQYHIKKMLQVFQTKMDVVR